MHYRYKKKPITEIWADENKLSEWQNVELSVIAGRVTLNEVEQADYDAIADALRRNPIDIAFWKELDGQLNHDLEAFVEERRRFLPEKLKKLWHRKITSYDTEEPAFLRMLRASQVLILPAARKLEAAIIQLAKKYRHTLLMGDTHGQWADLQTFGAMNLSWLADFRLTLRRMEELQETTIQSKISGPIGKYGTINPELERIALGVLGLVPYFGATQIIPRVYYLPLAESLSATVGVCSKIAGDLWKGATSAERLWQEPFKKTQKGSSAMPHKKNPITLEQIKGMDIMAQGFCGMVRKTVYTVRERDIRQSCVERVAWEDLFHVTLHSLQRLTGVLEKLQVYPDRMLDQVVATRGCYAASDIKELLRDLGESFGLSADDAYGVVQLAAFNVFEVDDETAKHRQELPENLYQADSLLQSWQYRKTPKPDSINRIIPEGRLRPTPQLAVTAEEVVRWNGICRQIFGEPANLIKWTLYFQPSFLIAGQDTLYRKILSE